MSILKRFSDIVSSNVNATLDKMEDPGKMIDQCLRNLKEDLSKVQSETASIMAEEARAKRELDKCDKEIADMQLYAIKALEANNEDDAKQFLTRKATLTSKREGLASAYELAAENAKKMREMHDKLVSDIQTLEERKEMVKGKMAVAKAQERMNKITSSVKQSNDNIGAFERMEAKADKALDKARAMAELNKGPENTIENLTEKYSGGSATVDAELAALKASLGK